MKVDVQEVLGVTQTGVGQFRGRSPLAKPSKASRGAFGGNIAGQAVVVAMKAVPEGFRPHSLHSYFVLPTSDECPVDWHVENISQGKNFANRHLRAMQKGRVVYYANVSLTRKNSHGEAQREYELYKQRTRNKSEDDDDDDENPVAQPFQFQTPYHDWFRRHNVNELPVDTHLASALVFHKIFPEMYDLDITEKDEKELPVTERRLSFLSRWGCPEEGTELVNVTKPYHYAGLAVLSDTLFLTRLARSLRIREVNLKDVIHYMSLSLDHVLYFHDDDFDGTDWIGFSCRPLRLSSNRVLFEGEMYNAKGVHIATMVQEGLVHLNGLEDYARL